MLSGEQAKEALQRFHVDDGREQRLARLKRLPGKLRKIGEGLLGDDIDWDHHVRTEESEKAKAAFIQQVDDLKISERARLFEALFPAIASHVERAWQLQMRLPYQGGWTRQAFRAPRHPELTSRHRVNWLESLSSDLEGYDQPIEWLAAWAPYLGPYGAAASLGVLLAAAIDGGGPAGDAVFDVLRASACGEHEIGSMGRHVTEALLTASRPDGWELVEGMLLAAQRQEGLRESILETADEAHPDAFRRMLRLIVEHDLARFSSVVRAVDVWFGLQWDAPSVRVVNDTIERVLRFLDDEDARKKALRGDDAAAVYLALWANAFDDAPAAILDASGLLKDSSVEKRFVGAHLLAQLNIDVAEEALLAALNDDDLRVAIRALLPFHARSYGELGYDGLFERIERLLRRLPAKKKVLEPIVWPWMKLPCDRAAAACTLLASLQTREPTRLIAYLEMMDTHRRVSVIEKLGTMKKWDTATRETLFALVGDAGARVREEAVKALAKCKVSEPEAADLEKLLTRKASDLRRGVLALLLNRKDEQVLASADRLLEAGDALQRLAGLDLLRQMAEAGRSAAACRRRAQDYRDERPEASDAEQTQLDALVGGGHAAVTLDNALGMMNPAERTPPTPPRKHDVVFMTRAALACIRSLDNLIHQHCQIAVQVESDEGTKTELLGTVRWGFPEPKSDVPIAEDLQRLPLRELWEQWWTERAADLRDADGLELVRAAVLLQSGLVGEYQRDYWAQHWPIKVWAKLFAPAEDEARSDDGVVQRLARRVKRRVEREVPAFLRPVQYESLLPRLLEWLLRIHPPQGASKFLLDAAETALAMVPKETLEHVPDEDDWRSDWRDGSPFVTWLSMTHGGRECALPARTPEDTVRVWGLLRWLDEPGTVVPRERASIEDLLAAYGAGGATEADFVDQLLGPRPAKRWGVSFHDLDRLTSRKPPKELEPFPRLRELVDRCRDRILEVEVRRGEAPTAASEPASHLSCVWGMATLVEVLRALGKEGFIRGWASDSVSKAAVFSHLVRVSFPLETDTPEAFAAAVKAAKIPEKRLVELALYAPQWARFVEPAIGWPGLVEGVWWMHAHTKDNQWRVDEQIREVWKGEVTQRTPLSGQDLLDGAVDVAWFRRTFEILGENRWEVIDAAGKYACGGNGHTRAQLFGNAMLGRVKEKELATRITSKRHQDSVRALGLLPLSDGKGRKEQVLARYRILQEFLRTSRQFGSQRQASEKRAVEIGMENLARTAGYPDPLRLQWAMEAEAIADLARGPVVATAGAVQVALSLDAQGEPDLAVTKGGKPLKSIPPAAKKVPAVAELTARKTELRRQASRMRVSLEQAMCRGDAFSGAELCELFNHPVLAAMLQRLVLVGEGIVGYPVDHGRALEDHGGHLDPVKKDERLRIAHPHDLLGTRQWHSWQKDCFAKERIQPFKQVFRELYVVTDAERTDATISRRYAGHQVQPRQALALLGGRGWVHHPEEGVHRTFHDLGLTAWLLLNQAFLTPAEVEAPTIEGVRFARRGDCRALPLTEIPPRMFSEVMRDVDLVVSVAHAGGVDPEASASTVEMRASLLRETCAALKITNVRVQDSHVLVEGKLAQYSVHLGSAVTHRMPGGMLCIVPVHSQHRGRLFLPFADDDPKTAEVLSKVLLLAKDAEIRDPTILQQILH